MESCWELSQFEWHPDRGISMRIVMIGTGYVGLVTGTCLAEVGHRVVGVDIDQDKIKQLCDGISPIYEPGLETMIRRNIDDGRLSFTTELSEALESTDVAFISVGTPEGEDGSADLKYVEAAARNIAQAMSGPLLIVVKSTVPVGTCDSVENIVKNELKQLGRDFRVRVASNPEFLKEGDAISDCMRPDRIVVGVQSDEDSGTFQRMYRPFIFDDPNKLLIMDRRSSELTKYGANSMLATRISFMNELSVLCERLDADIESVRRGMGTDDRIGRKFLYAGPGYGGSCFPKDVAALLKTGQKYGVDFSVLTAVSEANESQKERVSEKIKNYFKDLNGVRIGVWGLAFKPGTDDVRESPALAIINNLISWGAVIYAHDPKAVETFATQLGESDRVFYRDDAYEVLKGADALVLVTEWSEYRRPDWERVNNLMKSPVVFDLRNQYESGTLMGGGFHYECVGRPDSTRSAETH